MAGDTASDFIQKQPSNAMHYDSAEGEDRDEDDVPTQPRRTPASPLRRAVTLIFLGLLFAAIYARLQAKAEQRRNKVIYAKRYSEDFKFRPAASPIITESLKGGGTKLRGALPTPTPTPTPEKKKRRRRRTKKSKKSSTPSK